MSNLPQTIKKFSASSSTNRILVRVMLCAVAFDLMIIPVTVAKTFLFIRSTPASFSANLSASANPSIEVGPATEDFVRQLAIGTSTPKIVQKIRRGAFTVTGVMVTLNNDNIQVFEYPDHEIALKESTLLAQKYLTGGKTSPRDLDKRIYLNGTLVTFYSGRSNSIISSLDTNAGLSLTQPTRALSIR